VTEIFFSSTGDPAAIDCVGYPVKIVAPPDRPGDPRPTTLQFFDAAGRLTRTVDPEGRQTTFAWDQRNRLTTITYFDTSTETRTWGTDQGDPATLNLLTRSTDRNGNLETRAYDAHGRPSVRTIAANDPAIAVQEVCTYLDGTDLEASCTLKGETTSYVYDYRLRRIQTTVQPNLGTQLTRTTFYDATRRRIGSQDRYGRRTFTAYDINDYPVRRVRETVPAALEDALVLGGAFPTQQQLLELPRDLGANAAYLVRDTVYDPEFQPLETVDGRGIIDTQDFDQQGRGTTRVASAATVPATATHADIAAGTMATAITDPKVARQSRTLYDPQSNVVEVQHPRFFDPEDAEGFGQCRTTMTYTGRNLLASRTEADGSPVQATASFTYYLDRRDRTHTDFRGNTWTTHWHACCGRLQARLRPDGTGSVANTDFAGNVTHTARVPNLPTTPSDQAPEAVITDGDPPPYPWHDPTDAETVNETTTRFDARHRPTHRTEWLVPLDSVVDHAREQLGTGAIPIAGEDGIPATDGLTTRWEYDDDLTDGVGLDATFADYVALLDLGAGSDGYGVAVTNPENETTLTFSDGLQRPVMRIDGEGDARQTIYDQVIASTPGAPGALVAATGIVDPDRSGHTGLKLTSSSRSDAAGRTLATVDAEGQISTASFDANANRLAHRDPNGVGEDCAFDPADRPTVCTDTQGDTTFTVYDAASSVIQTVDGEGVTALGGPGADSPPFIQGALGVTTCTFDARDRKTACVDRIQGTTAFAYDPNNNLAQITDAEGGVTAYAYDVRNLLTREEFPTHTPGTDPGDPGNDAREYAYDAANRLVLRDDQQGDDTVYVYDMANRLLERQYPDSLEDVFSYDDAKRLLSAESTRYANTVTRTWNEDSTLATEGLVIDGNTRTIQHAYDAANRRIACVYPDGDQATAAWTDRNQLASCTYAGENVASLLYDPGMRERSRTYDNGVATTTTYRADNLKATIQAPGVVDFTYAHDANKRKTSETDAILTDYSQDFAYDPLDRLTDWTRSGTLGAGEMNRTWDLSLVGDWDQTTVDGVPQNRDHNAVHEITAIDAVPARHDRKGNMTSNPLKLQEYTWDFDNRLTSLSPAAAGGTDLVAHFAFDAATGLTDRSGHGLDGIAVGAAAVQPGGGRVLGSAHFDGSGDGITVPDHHLLNTGTHAQRTVSLWFKADDLDGRQLLYEEGGVWRGLAIFLDGDTLFVRGWNVNESNPGAEAEWVGTTHSLAGLAADRWYHVALVLDATPGSTSLTANAFTAYVDGQFLGTGPGSQLWPHANDVGIGRIAGNTEFHDFATDAPDGAAFHGQIDEVRILNTALSAADIAALAALPSYRYDALGRRVQKTAGTTTTTFVCAGAQVFSEYVDGLHDRDYVYGMYIDDPLALIQDDGDRFYYHCNHLYSVAAITGTAGAVVERYTYDSYGKRYARDAAGVLLANQDGIQEYGFTGRRLDPETGLWYFRARYYGEDLGRFINRDPLGFPDGNSFYTAYFVPNFKDPSGLHVTDVRIGGPQNVDGDARIWIDKTCKESALYLDGLLKYHGRTPKTINFSWSELKRSAQGYVSFWCKCAEGSEKFYFVEYTPKTIKWRDTHFNLAWSPQIEEAKGAIKGTRDNWVSGKYIKYNISGWHPSGYDIYMYTGAAVWKTDIAMNAKWWSAHRDMRGKGGNISVISSPFGKAIEARETRSGWSDPIPTYGPGHGVPSKHYERMHTLHKVRGFWFDRMKSGTLVIQSFWNALGVGQISEFELPGAP